MEKFKKVCTEIKTVGQPDQHGNEAFNIGFADGTSGFFKCKKQDLFVVGAESEYYMDHPISQKTGKPYDKIVRVSSVEYPQQEGEKKSSTAGTSGSGKGANKDDKFDHDGMMRSVSIKALCELRAGCAGYDISRLISESEEVFDYLKWGVSNGEPKDGHKKALESPAPEEIDTLPW